jgi:hypothetical protein
LEKDIAIPMSRDLVQQAIEHFLDCLGLPRTRLPRSLCPSLVPRGLFRYFWLLIFGLSRSCTVSAPIPLLCQAETHLPWL